MKAARREVDLLGFVEPVRREEAQAQLRFASLPVDVGLDLIEERRHEVEGDRTCGVSARIATMPQ
jgi:hypothetical protein